jgi:hypothetical protein
MITGAEPYGTHASCYCVELSRAAALPSCLGFEQHYWPMMGDDSETEKERKFGVLLCMRLACRILSGPLVTQWRAARAMRLLLLFLGQERRLL